LWLTFFLQRMSQMVEAWDGFRRVTLGYALPFFQHDLDQPLHCVLGHAPRFFQRLAIRCEARERRTRDGESALRLGSENKSVCPRHRLRPLHTFALWYSILPTLR